MASIFGSALSYVQEKEEPVDFLDLFLEMDQSNIDLGVDEEIVTNQKSRKKVILHPLNNNSNKIQNNTAMNSTTSSFFPSKNHNSNTSQARLLSPLQRKNSESTLEKSKKHKEQQQFEDTGLFSNFFDKRRLQQIEFLPTNLTNNYTSKDNHKNHLGADPISVYSLKQGNEMLKKNFNLSIGQSVDQPKRFMVRRIKLKKQELDETETAERRHSDEDNRSSQSSNNYSNDNQALMQLKRAQFGSNIRNSSNNSLVNLQNLLASSISPTNQLGLRTASERTFQINKLNTDNTGGSNSIDQKKLLNSTKNNFQNNQDNPANFKNKGRKQVEQREKKLQNNVEKGNKQKKLEQALSNGRYDNNRIPQMMMTDFFEEQNKQLPLFSLNFNKTLETRLLLNNLVPQ